MADLYLDALHALFGLPEKSLRNIPKKSRRRGRRKEESKLEDAP